MTLVDPPHTTPPIDSGPITATELAALGALVNRAVDALDHARAERAATAAELRRIADGLAIRLRRVADRLDTPGADRG